MDRRLLAAALVVLVVAAAAVVVYATQERGWDITYDLDGGEFSSDPPTHYMPGDEFGLPEPVRDGYVFRGWHTGSGPFDGITPETTGDIHVTAQWIPAVEHSVTYELGGGTLPEDALDTFVGGVGMTLPQPTRDGYRFAGWFEDPGFTVPIVVIDTETFGDVTVYACWDDADLSGTGYTWTVSGSYYNGTIPHTMEGTVTQQFIVGKDSWYYTETTRDITYSWPDGSTTDDSVTGAWTFGRPVMSEYVGTEEVDGYPCTVWRDEDGETVWLYHLTVVVRVLQDEGSTRIVQELTDVFTFVPETTFVPTVSAEMPITVEGVGVTEIGDSITLTAEGEGFTGWYSGDCLISRNATVTISRADPTLRLEARAAEGYTVVDPGTTVAELGLSGGTVTDADGNVVSSDLGSLEPGYYRVTAQKGPVSSYSDIFIDETRVLSFDWEFDGERYHLSLDVRYSDVYLYTFQDPYGNTRISLADAEYIDHFHTVDDPTLRSLMVRLVMFGQGMDRTDFARFVLSFVQNIPYIDDSDSAGTRDYWKYPLETLWDGGGDCEDSTILYDTLMLMAGYDVAFLLFQDHAMSAVSVPVDGESVSADGIRYVLCETTTVADMGLTSVGHYPSDVYFWCPVGGE